MNLSEWVNGIATSSGMQVDNAELKLLLADVGLTKLEVPSELEHLATTPLKDMLSLEAAKNNPELKKHFFATAMYGVEKDIDRLGKEYFDLSDEQAAELKKLDAQKRLSAIFKLGKEKLEKKDPSTDNEKVKKLETTISQLNAAALEKETAYEAEKKTLKQGFLDKRREHVFKELFQTYEYTDAIPKEVQEQTARALVMAKLQQDNNKVIFKEEDDSLQLFTNEDTAVYQNNKPVNLKQYVDSVLAEKKLLKITPAKVDGDGKKKEPMLVATSSHNGSSNIDNSAFLRDVESALQDVSSKS